MSAPPLADDGYHPYAGWVAGGLVILGIVVVMGVFWFMYHPI